MHDTYNNRNSIAWRATSLVKLFFTKLKGISVTELQYDKGVDLLVNVNIKPKSLLFFGIELKAYTNVDMFYRSKTKIMQQSNYNSNMPLILVVVDVLKDELYYDWLVYPAGLNQPKNKDANLNRKLKSLTLTEAKDIIDKVKRYS